PNRAWRAEPVAGSKAREELWVGVKCQTNAEIAGSPRNAFGGSPGVGPRGGRAPVGRGGSRLPTPAEPRSPRDQAGSEGVGAKLHVREGNNPDRQLRPLSAGSVEKEVGPLRQPGGWLRSSHPGKSA